MFNWFSNLFASMSYDAAINSAGLASHGGMCQIKEPDILKKEANEHKERMKKQK